MSAPELWLLPPEPSPIRKTALPWFGALTPVVLSLTLFAVTKSPLSLVIVVAAPATMWLTSIVTRKREHKRFRAENAHYDRESESLLNRVVSAHERERRTALRSHPAAFLLGYTAQRSELSAQGAAATPRAHALKQRIETNPRLPVFADRRPHITFSGTLANRLKSHIEAHAFTQPESGDQLVVERINGQLVLRPDTALTLALPPTRALMKHRAVADEQHRKERVRAEQERTRMRQRASRNDRLTLEIELGHTTDGNPVIVDVVREGPHALIAGSTGSGKSELLRTIIAQIARRYTPEQAQFLLIDFKGGTALQHLEPLPHVLSLLTDLEHAAVVRVVLGLTAEIRRREHVLRRHRAGDCAQLPVEARLARLIIVVDEFATLVNELPELHAVFVDIAARGRALGMHLIIATQRPGGVVRDALAANCALRFCLRVTSVAEGTGVLGVPSETSPVGLTPGGCILASNGQITPVWNISRTSEHLIHALAHDASVPSGPVTPWLPPLPEHLSIEQWNTPPRGTVYLGLSDEPEIQQQNRLTYQATSDGSLLIVGGRRSGKTNACHLIARQWAQACTHYSSVHFPTTEIAAVWHQLRRLEQRCNSHNPSSDLRQQDAQLWVFDDIDQMFSRLNPEQLVVGVQILLRAARELPQGDALLLTTMRFSGPLSHVLSSVSQRLFLRFTNREEHVSAGLPASTFHPQAPPGRGQLNGVTLQLAFADELHACEHFAPDPLPTDRAVVIVTSQPQRWQGYVETAGNTFPSLTLSDSLSLLARSHELGVLRREALWILDACNPAEVKQLLLTSEPQPPGTSASRVVTWSAAAGFTLSEWPCASEA